MNIPVTTFPKIPTDLTPEMLTAVMGDRLEGACVTAVEMRDTKVFGTGDVSTAGRATVGLQYSRPVPGLPEQVLVKLARHDSDLMKPLYANEVAVYNRLRPEIAIETPQVYGAAYDPETVSFLLLLEDLSLRGATFPNVKSAVTVDHVRKLIEGLASLHARYWESPRFSGDLAWLETHLVGGTHDFFEDMDAARGNIIREVEQEQFKREIVERLRTDVDEMHDLYHRLQEHQATLQQTLLHGDSHIGNTYRLADGAAGFVDWQLTVRGYFMHDLAYLIVTSLPIGLRRAHERELIGYYLDLLRRNGVGNAPGADEAWLEYRRAGLWNFYIGWLTTPATFYGFEIVLLNILRTSTAVEDLGSLEAVRALR